MQGQQSITKHETKLSKSLRASEKTELRMATMTHSVARFDAALDYILVEGILR
jgi:hypothetical protein